jgi:hypothetical protein
MGPRSTRKAKSIATKAAELAFAAPQVVAHRVARMAMSGAVPTERDKREFQLMVKEKEVAFAQAFTAMAKQTAVAQQALAASMFRSFWSPSFKGKSSPVAVALQMQAAAMGIVNKGMAPVHQKAVANAKRLAKTRLK